ncbi:hypothetical protein CYY_000249 [Polysphondylium violaceum]|uniref:Uncharacterized protein n=1 Tax=Polysphondylium violaceum TaxID=133409 RepID=A0A8J4Q438_9MYCE|nr:hypothetical protein CYY_000249 [Polysphondylium violaceum]
MHKRYLYDNENFEMATQPREEDEEYLDSQSPPNTPSYDPIQLNQILYILEVTLSQIPIQLNNQVKEYIKKRCLTGQPNDQIQFGPEEVEKQDLSTMAQFIDTMRIKSKDFSSKSIFQLIINCNYQISKPIKAACENLQISIEENSANKLSSIQEEMYQMVVSEVFKNNSLKCLKMAFLDSVDKDKLFTFYDRDTNSDNGKHYLDQLTDFFNYGLKLLVFRSLEAYVDLANGVQHAHQENSTSEVGVTRRGINIPTDNITFPGRIVKLCYEADDSTINKMEKQYCPLKTQNYADQPTKLGK